CTTITWESGFLPPPCTFSSDCRLCVWRGWRSGDSFPISSSTRPAPSNARLREPPSQEQRGGEAEGRRQKAEGRRQKAEGRRQKAEGRRRTLSASVTRDAGRE